MSAVHKVARYISVRFGLMYGGGIILRLAYSPADMMKFQDAAWVTLILLTAWLILGPFYDMVKHDSE